MPAAISSKLSPLTKLQYDFYTKTISNKNFKADAKFCSLAKLACSSFSSLEKSLSDSLVYNKYGGSTNSLDMKVNPFAFFIPSNLREESTIHFSIIKDSIPHRAFLPPQIASKMYVTLEGVMNFFPYSSKNPIETSISDCSAAAIKWEIKSSPKSLEEMISFSKTALRSTKLLALTSKNTRGSNQMLMIEKVKHFNVKKIVGCHEVFLPFATYFCHSLPSTRIYAVDLVEPVTRTPVNTAMAVCHIDTSSWPASHVAFKILKFGPGRARLAIG